MSPYRLVLFDLDGTLVDSLGDIADALNAGLAEHGLRTLADDEVFRLVGRGVKCLVSGAVAPADPALVPSVTAAYQRHYRARPVGRTRVYAGVAATLAKIAVDKAVVTNKPGEIARRIVEELKLTPYFAFVLGEDDVGRSKPDPRVIELARERMGTSRAATLLVGDSTVDAATAANAGIDCALVAGGYAEAGALAAAPARFRLARFEELLAVL